MSERETALAGAAVFMDAQPEGTPPPLLHNLEHNEVLHRRVVILTVVTREVPYLENEEGRLETREIGLFPHPLGPRDGGGDPGRALHTSLVRRPEPKRSERRREPEHGRRR